jgi:hypothetical protein
MPLMGYALPILADAEGQFTSWVFAQAADGSRVLLVFDEASTRLDDLVQVYQRVEPPVDHRLGVITMPADSLVALVRALEDLDPSLFQEAILINEGDPAFESILREFLSQKVVDIGTLPG